MIGKIQKTIDYLDSAYVNHQWGYTLHYLNRYNDAVEQYQKALNEYDSINIIMNIGWAYNLSCRFNEAITQSKKALEDPDTKGRAYELWGSVMLDQKNYRKAAELYEKAAKVDQNTDNVKHHLFNWGLALGNLNLYDEAIAKYREAIALDENYPYPYHNIAQIHDYQGNYLRASEVRVEALKAYELSRDKYKDTSDYFLYYGSIYQEFYLALDEAESIYNAGLEIYPNHPKINATLARLYIRRKEEAGFNDSIPPHKISEYHCKAWELYRRINRHVDDWNGTVDESHKLIQLSRLEIDLGEYQSAKEHLRKALKKDDSMEEIYAWLGTVAIKEKKPKDAIKHFEKALQLSPDDLDIRSNLAKAYSQAKMIDKAENEYNKILRATSCHVDALIGLGEVYATMGDIKKKADSASADDFYCKAIKYYTKAIELDNSQKRSRKLGENEIGSLHYSRGYVSVMLFECRKKEDHGLLHQAQDDFRIHKNHPNYHKAERAIEKITDRLEPSGEQSSLERRGPYVVSGLAIVVFLISHFGIFVGLPQATKVGYSIDEVFLQVLMPELDNVPKDQRDNMLNNLKNLLGLEFTTRENLMEGISKIFDKDSMTRLKPLMDKQKVVERAERRFVPIKIGSYAALAFGSLVLLVAGLYLKQISKLKFGGIELDKSPIEVTSITGPIGVTK
jgi:tetratricopeptide (TPR) repeat protein